MLNRTFSVEKGREISPFEAQIGSIKRRLVDPLGRKRDRLMQRPLHIPSQVGRNLTVYYKSSLCVPSKKSANSLCRKTR
jgi:hypothetical protein